MNWVDKFKTRANVEAFYWTSFAWHMHNSFWSAVMYKYNKPVDISSVPKNSPLEPEQKKLMLEWVDAKLERTFPWVVDSDGDRYDPRKLKREAIYQIISRKIDKGTINTREDIEAALYSQIGEKSSGISQVEIDNMFKHIVFYPAAQNLIAGDLGKAGTYAILAYVASMLQDFRINASEASYVFSRSRLQVMHDWREQVKQECPLMSR